MSPPPPRSSEALGSVDRAVDLLFHLHAAGAPAGVTSIATALGLPKSSVHRLLKTLAGRGLVERDGAGRYRPGIALVTLGVGVLEREPLIALARPSLEAGAAETGETFFLVGARSGELVVLDKAEGTGFLRAAPRIGQGVPVHASAVGKLYAAHAPEAIAALDDADRLEAFTGETRTDPAALALEIERARTQGFASNRDEWIEGLSVFAAPVWNGERMVGAVAMAAPSARIPRLGGEALGPAVAATAARVSRAYGEPDAQRSAPGATPP